MKKKLVGFEILSIVIAVGAYLVSVHVFKASIQDAALSVAFALWAFTGTCMLVSIARNSDTAREANLKFGWAFGSIAVDTAVTAAAVTLTPWIALGALALPLFLLAPAEKQTL